MTRTISCNNCNQPERIEIVFSGKARLTLGGEGIHRRIVDGNEGDASVDTVLRHGADDVELDLLR